MASSAHESPAAAADSISRRSRAEHSPSRPEPIGQDVENLLQTLAGLTEQDRQGEDVKIADPVVVWQAGLRAHAQTARDGLAVANGRQRRAAAQVARDDLDVGAAQQLGHAPGDVAMAGAVEPPAPDAQLVQASGMA